MVGLTRFELVTPRLSSVCSNQLSYRPSLTSTSPFSTASVFHSVWSHSVRETFSKNRYRPDSLKTR